MSHISILSSASLPQACSNRGHVIRRVDVTAASSAQKSGPDNTVFTIAYSNLASNINAVHCAVASDGAVAKGGGPAGGAPIKRVDRHRQGSMVSRDEESKVLI